MTRGILKQQFVRRSPKPLMIRARTDANAFAEVYDAYGERILRYLVRRVFDVELAFDMHQEVFASAFERREQFRGNTAEEEQAWLFTIARSQISGYVRHGYVERAAMARLRLQRYDLDDQHIRRLEELAALETLKPAIRRAVEGLPADQREAIALRVLQECSYAEIAKHLGVSNDVIRSRVSRGLRTVALALEDLPTEMTGESR